MNLAARVAARSAIEAAGGRLRFDQIGEVTLKGFSEPTELLVAGQAP